MQKNIITNKITPCCGLPFSVAYWWVSNLTLNSESDRQFILSKISQNGTISIDGWKVLINSGTLEADASLTKSEFLAWFDCGKQPKCEQLKLIVEGFKISNWDYYKNSIEKLNEAFQELENKLKLKYNDVSETEAVDIIQRVDQFTGENVNYRETTKWHDGSMMNDSKVDGVIFIKKCVKYYVRQYTGYINIKWFGAKGDGITDDTASIIEANEFSNSIGGGELYYPEGTYLISSPIYFFSNVNHKGAGVDITILRGISSNNIFGEAIHNNVILNTGIEAMTIDGNSSNVSFPTDDADGNSIRLNSVKNSVFKNLKIQNSIFNAISIYNLSDNNVFENIIINDTGKIGKPPSIYSFNGIFIEAGSSRNKITNCRIVNSRQYGIWVGSRDADNYDNEIINVYIVSTTGDAIHIGDEATSNKCHRCRVINPTILDCEGIGIRIFHAGSGSIIAPQIIGGIIRNCNQGIYVGDNVIDALISNVAILNNGDFGITITSSEVVAVNNLIKQHGISNVRNLGSNNVIINTDGYKQISNLQNIENLIAGNIKFNEIGVRVWDFFAENGLLKFNTNDNEGIVDLSAISALKLPMKATKLAAVEENSGLIYLTSNSFVIHIGSSIKEILL